MITPSSNVPSANKSARATEESFVSLAAWVILAILGVGVFIAGISVIGGIALLVPLPISISRRVAAAKNTIRLREEHVKAYDKAKNGNATDDGQ